MNATFKIKHSDSKGMQEKETWVFGADRKFHPSGSLFSKASWCQTVTLGTAFSIRTSHPCKILIISGFYISNVSTMRHYLRILYLKRKCYTSLSQDSISQTQVLYDTISGFYISNTSTMWHCSGFYISNASTTGHYLRILYLKRKYYTSLSQDSTYQKQVLYDTISGFYISLQVLYVTISGFYIWNVSTVCHYLRILLSQTQAL